MQLNSNKIHNATIHINSKYHPNSKLIWMLKALIRCWCQRLLQGCGGMVLTGLLEMEGEASLSVDPHLDEWDWDLFTCGWVVVGGKVEAVVDRVFDGGIAWTIAQWFGCCFLGGSVEDKWFFMLLHGGIWHVAEDLCDVVKVQHVTAERISSEYYNNGGGWKISIG